MAEDKITFEDVKEYEGLFSIAPSFLLEGMIRRNSNLVLKFKGPVKSYLNKLTPAQRHKLSLILDSEISDLQEIMAESYQKTHKKQFKLLASPQATPFIEKNLVELKKLV